MFTPSQSRALRLVLSAITNADDLAVLTGLPGTAAAALLKDLRGAARIVPLVTLDGKGTRGVTETAAYELVCESEDVNFDAIGFGLVSAMVDGSQTRARQALRDLKVETKLARDIVAAAADEDDDQDY
jgi:hypothetical protein